MSQNEDISVIPFGMNKPQHYLIFKNLFLLTVPQVLAMMVDLEEEPDWSMQDEPEEEDTDRWEFPCTLYYHCVFMGFLFL